MTKTFAAKAMLGVLAVFASIDSAEAGRRNRNKCCPPPCCPTTSCCNSGGGYASSGYSGGSYAAAPMYGMPAPVVVNPMPGGVVASGYADPNHAKLRVKVPTAETRLWVGDQQFQETGMERTLSIPVAAGQAQKLTVTAQWIKDGATIVRKKDIELRPGLEAVVTFSETDTDS